MVGDADPPPHPPLPGRSETGCGTASRQRSTASPPMGLWRSTPRRSPCSSSRSGRRPTPSSATIPARWRWGWRRRRERNRATSPSRSPAAWRRRLATGKLSPLPVIPSGPDLSMSGCATRPSPPRSRPPAATNASGSPPSPIPTRSSSISARRMSPSRCTSATSARR